MQWKGPQTQKQLLLSISVILPEIVSVCIYIQDTMCVSKFTGLYLDQQTSGWGTGEPGVQSLIKFLCRKAHRQWLQATTLGLHPSRGSPAFIVLVLQKDQNCLSVYVCVRINFVLVTKMEACTYTAHFAFEKQFIYFIIGNPLQYSCPENSMDRGAWQAIVHGMTKNWKRLSEWHKHYLCTFGCAGSSLPHAGFL